MNKPMLRITLLYYWPQPSSEQAELKYKFDSNATLDTPQKASDTAYEPAFNTQQLDAISFHSP